MLPGAPSERDRSQRLSFGVINVDKPPGPSSHQVVAWIKELLGVDRAAHAGTLDPAVTGCLPVLLGNGTRLAQAMLVGTKTYVAVLRLHDEPPSSLDDVLEAFTGELYQKPPRKSAVSRRLRTRTVHQLEVLDRDGRDVLLDIECESGTYVRKLCHDLGLALGVGGQMGELRRTGTTPFEDTDLVTLHDLSDAKARADTGEPADLDAMLAPGERALSHLPRVTIAPSAAESVCNGAPVYAPGVIAADPADADELVVCVTPNDAAICLGRLVGEPDADEGLVVDLERVLVSPDADQHA